VETRLHDPNSQVWVLDPLALTLEGELASGNLVLTHQDVIFIPTAERFVDVQGTAIPGRYELLASETLGDILRLAGTVNYHADLANAVVRRYDDQGCLTRIVVNLFPALDDLSVIEQFPLCNRDRIDVLPREERIFVLGEVNEAGAFGFHEDSTVLDYIAQAKGETPDAHLAWIAIIRQSRDRRFIGTPAQVTQVNFKEIHKGLPLCEDIALLPGDVIYVPPKGFDFEVAEIISAIGTVVTAYAVSTRDGNSSD